jgi:hypothetical protein
MTKGIPWSFQGQTAGIVLVLVLDPEPLRSEDEDDGSLLAAA